MERDDTLLRAFARLLPRDFRDRVFEPALADMRLDTRRRTPWEDRRVRLLFLFECLRLGVAQHVWHRGRPTRFGAALLVTLFVSALLVQRINYRATRATSGHEPAGQIAPPSKTLHR